MRTPKQATVTKKGILSEETSCNAQIKLRTEVKACELKTGDLQTED